MPAAGDFAPAFALRNPMACRLLSAIAMGTSDLLDLALKAHGGLDRWREVKRLDVRVSLTGALYHLKATRKGCRTSP